MCLCVHILLCVYLCMCVQARLYFAAVCIHVLICVHALLCVCMCASTSVYSHTCVFMPLWVCVLFSFIHFSSKPPLKSGKKMNLPLNFNLPGGWKICAFYRKNPQNIKEETEVHSDASVIFTDQLLTAYAQPQELRPDGKEEQCENQFYRSLRGSGPRRQTGSYWSISLKEYLLWVQFLPETRKPLGIVSPARKFEDCWEQGLE